MKNYIFAAIFALLSNQVGAQVVEDTPASRSTHHAKSNSSVLHVKKNSPIAEVPRLPPPSKESLGFFTALSNLNWDLMDLYFNQGADINCRNCNTEQVAPLLYVVSNSNTSGWGVRSKVIQWLIEHGANVNQANSHGVTPIMLGAAWTQGAVSMGSQVAQGDSEILSYLIEHGANALAEDNEGNNALFYIQPAASQNQGFSVSYDISYQQIARVLVEKGADINKQNKMGETILSLAASKCADASVKFLLNSGADKSKTNKLKQTALDIAIEKATIYGQNSYCNNTIKLLQSSQSINQRNASVSSSQNVYAGNYSGSYTGDDYGSFQVGIAQDGRVTLTGKSSQNNQMFSGNGKISNDGSLGISIGNISSGATFQGSINPKNGAIYGTWKNAGLAGNFSGNKQGQANPIEVLGSILDGLNKILTPQ